MATIAVLATLDSKADAAEYVSSALLEADAEPWLMDLSLKPHDAPGADVTGDKVARASGTTWDKLAEMDRTGAAETMIAGGTKILLEKAKAGEIAGVIGIGGANGSTVFCAMMRALDPLFPKVMVTPVAATAAVQWYVAESDIAMFPTIGDILLNRITKAVIHHAAFPVAGMARAWTSRKLAKPESTPLVGLSAFGNVQKSVDVITEQLEASGFEVMHFHSSGPGGKALENLAERRELVGVIDLVLSELTDELTGGVYSAGPDRLTAAGAQGLPQVVVPGCIDHTNWWVGEAPERYKSREFYQYNVEILLMRTNAEEMIALGELVGERLNASKGPVVVLIPKRGLSSHIDKPTQTIDGEPVGQWGQPETDACFAQAVKKHLSKGPVKELDLHINDEAFATACVDEFLSLLDAST
jgi:uncharacterized protein (UPF0261 family)